MLRVMLLLALAAPPPATAAVRFIHVWPQWRDAAVFKRMSEYFTGRENPGRILIRRTHPETRAGYYYLVRLKDPDVPLGGAKFVLDIITPASPDTRRYVFPVDAGLGEHVFELGLTGPDWPGKKAHPVAWRLDLVSASGDTLASAQSFLWSLK